MSGSSHEAMNPGEFPVDSSETNLVSSQLTMHWLGHAVLARTESRVVS